MEFEPSTSSSSAAMPDSPPLRAARHRRAQSEILLGGVLPDDLAFDGDLGIVGEEEDEEEEDDDEEGDRLFALLIDAGKLAEPPEPAPHPPPPPPPARPRHQHSYSMDGSTSVASAAGAWRSVPEAKKAVSDTKLAELVLVDPKRAKRILANRQSAARSKERKMRYIAELERKVQTLQTEATTLSAQLAMLQRDTTGLTTENSELKLRVQTMEQQVRLQDALNNRLRDEIQQLKIAAGQASTSSVKMASLGVPSFGAYPQSYQRNHMQTLLAAQQLQQLQIHWQHQQQQMYLQQQHQSTDQQQPPPQEALPLPLPGDMKMKGALMSSHTQNGGSSDGHALKSET